MSKNFKKYIGILVRVVGKLYQIVITIYTRMVRLRDRDPSRILVDLFTPEQLAAQEDLDQFKNQDSHAASTEIMVIIPFKDRWHLTAACLRSLSAQDIVGKCPIQVILVDNGSVEPATAIGLQDAQKTNPKLSIQSMRMDCDFNFSRLNNEAFKKFRLKSSQVLLFLNNDVEILQQDALRKAVSYLERNLNIGVVGAALMYPNKKIQHLFVAPGVKIIAAHPLKGLTWRPNLAWFEKAARPVPAVTGAFMMVRSEDFTKVGMFDESLPTLAQDVVLCLTVQRILNKYTIAVNFTEVIHHESLTKAPNFPAAEVDIVYQKYGTDLQSNKFFNEAFSRWSEKPLLGLPGEPNYPAKLVISCWQ